MKYLWITHDPNLSGANKCMLEVIEGLHKLGHESEVITTRKAGLVSKLVKCNTPNHVLPYYNRTGNFSVKRIKQGIRNTLAIFKLILLIKKFHPDKVISNTVSVSVGAWASFFIGKKHIWYVHEFGKEDHGIVFPFGEDLANKLVGRLSETVIVVSNVLKEKYTKYIDENKVKVLYNYPKTSKEYLKKDNNSNFFNLIMLSQISQGKRQIDAINAIKLLNDGTFRLTIVGNVVDNQYFQLLLKEIKNKRLERQIEIMGYVQEPFKEIKKADAVLICSESEAFGRVTIEAMKLGIPVIGANAGATKEIIEHGETGLLYECGNYKDLAEKIQYLRNNKDTSRSIATNALLYSKDVFSNENFLKRLKEIFLE